MVESSQVSCGVVPVFPYGCRSPAPQDYPRTRALDGRPYEDVEKSRKCCRPVHRDGRIRRGWRSLLPYARGWQLPERLWYEDPPRVSQWQLTGTVYTFH